MLSIRIADRLKSCLTLRSVCDSCVQRVAVDESTIFVYMLRVTNDIAYVMYRILYYPMRYYTTPHCTTLHHSTLRYTTPHYTTLH